MVEKAFDNILRTPFHKLTKRHTISRAYRRWAQLIGPIEWRLHQRTLGAHNARLFDYNAAAYRLSKRELNSSTYVALISTFIRCEKDSATEGKNFCTDISTKVPTGIVTTYIDVNESPKSLPDSKSDDCTFESRLDSDQNFVTASAKIRVLNDNRRRRNLKHKFESRSQLELQNENDWRHGDPMSPCEVQDSKIDNKYLIERLEKSIGFPASTCVLTLHWMTVLVIVMGGRTYCLTRNWFH